MSVQRKKVEKDLFISDHLGRELGIKAIERCEEGAILSLFFKLKDGENSKKGEREVLVRYEKADFSKRGFWGRRIGDDFGSCCWFFDEFWRIEILTYKEGLITTYLVELCKENQALKSRMARIEARIKTLLS